MTLTTVRGKLVLNSALILGVMALAILYHSLATFELARSVDLLFRGNLRLSAIGADLKLTESSLADYLRTRSSDALKDHIMHSTRLADGARWLNREIVADEPLLLERDLALLLDRYLADCEQAVRAKRGRDVQAYADHYDSSVRSAALVRLLIARVQEYRMGESLVAYAAFSGRIPWVLGLNAVLVLAAALTGFMFSLRVSWQLTDPLARLARAARAVGRGEHLADLSLPVTGDEIGTLSSAFMAMQSSIHHAFEELKNKAELERRFYEERTRVLDMGHRLKDAELLALQTQINPHFLFNTLAAGMQLALSENAERTADFMDNLAVFIRYALKPTSRWVRVAEEIECVERYIWLLRLRFGERYRFLVDVDPAALAGETPALVLQPLVENSVAHGLRDCESGGEIRVTARREPGWLVMEVADTGTGMPREEIDRILRNTATDDPLPDAGIGLRNVLRRVLLSSNGAGRVAIDSEPGRGTAIRIGLPWPEVTA